jgi:hypothetical protein
MHGTEMITDLQLKQNNRAITVEALMRALNTHLESVGIQADEYSFCVSPALRYGNSDTVKHVPEDYRWLIAFAIPGESEGYYIHVGAIGWRTKTYVDLGFAKTWTPENAYTVARETQRSISAAMWN